MPVGGGVGHISANDLVFVYQQRGVYRGGGTGEVGDLVDIAHDLFSGVFLQIVALTLLQQVVAVKNRTVLVGNPHLTGFCRGFGDLPAEVLQELNSAVIPCRLGGGGNGDGGGAVPAEYQNQRQNHGGHPGQNQQPLFEIDLCGHKHHDNPSLDTLHYSLFPGGQG